MSKPRPFGSDCELICAPFSAKISDDDRDSEMQVIAQRRMGQSDRAIWKHQPDVTHGSRMPEVEELPPSVQFIATHKSARIIVLTV